MPHILVIGGGITGASTARDLAMRDCEVTLLDRGRLGTGTTGSSHGLLHSGARYADVDPAVARDCITENRILRDIAPHCIDGTGGLFLATSDSPAGYPGEKRDACRDAGIPVEDRDPAALPGTLTEDIVDAFAVPDAAVDPGRLTLATALAAKQHGADIRTDTRVTAIHRDGGRVTGVTAAGEMLAADHVVNAAGPWTGRVAALADATVPLTLSGGVMATVAADVPAILNRCRPPASGDIAVPHPDGAVLGTTSTPVDQPGADAPDPDAAVDTLRRGLSAILPAARDAPLVERYWGIRPLYAPEDVDGGRSTSRHHAVVDHAARNDLEGFTSVVGGKLTTARRMARDAADAVCDVLSVDASCRTADEPLPGRDDLAALDAAVDRFGADVPAGR